MRRAAVVPPQHGAWAFLILPVALGVIAAEWSLSVVPAVLAWVSLYPLSWALTNRLMAPRPERFSRPVRLWSGVAAPFVFIATWVDPWLVWVGLAYLVPFAANLAFARARRERDFANDAILIAECSGAVPVVAGIVAGSSAWTPPWSSMSTPHVALMTLTCALALLGSTLHVKSLIRERNNPRYAAASRVFASLSVVVMLGAAAFTGVSLWIAVPFAVLAGRAWLLHDPTWRPARIGLVELAGLVAVAGFAAPLLS